MTDIMLGAMGGLVLLAGLSIYSAVRLAKKTDEIVSGMEREEPAEDERSARPLLVVHFPKAVFSCKPRRHVTTNIER
jgi:hypothetical protein